MSGVQIHTNEPISAPNPRTEPPSTTSQASGPAATPATTTATATSNSYQPAQPGSRPPAPTGTPTNPTSSYVPQSTPTSNYTPATTTSSYAPPAPQPGAVPTPNPATTKVGASIPPPPKAGEKLQPASYYQPAAQPTPAPSQQPPTTSSNFLPAATQGTLNQPLRGQPPAGTTGIAHPPGYQQNQYAADSGPYGSAGGQYNSNVNETGGSSQGGILGGIGQAFNNLTGAGNPGGSGSGSILGGSQRDSSGEGEGIVNTVSQWATGAGKGLVQLENEVWKRVNGEK